MCGLRSRAAAFSVRKQQTARRSPMLVRAQEQPESEVPERSLDFGANLRAVSCLEGEPEWEGSAKCGTPSASGRRQQRMRVVTAGSLHAPRWAGHCLPRVACFTRSARAGHPGPCGRTSAASCSPPSNNDQPLLRLKQSAAAGHCLCYARLLCPSPPVPPATHLPT